MSSLVTAARARASILAAALLAACSPDRPGPEPREAARRSVKFADPETFAPPGPAERRAAVGPLSGLDPALARALAETRDFRPQSPPEPGDWLDRVRERGQTYAEFVASPAPRPDLPGKGRDTIYILPIGDFPDGFIVEQDRVVLVRSPAPAVLEDFTRRYFAMEAETLPALAQDALNAPRRLRRGRDQLHAPAVLEALAPRLPEDGYCLIALTNDDLYADESQEFSFGYASPATRVGVYSFARYDPLFNGEPRAADYLQLILTRTLKIMAHEIGHMFGLEHCVHYACVMNGASDLVETDRSPPFLCPVCLRKLQFAVGFDPAARYRELAAFFDGVELAGERDWLEGRVRFVTGEY